MSEVKRLDYGKDNEALKKAKVADAVEKVTFSRESSYVTLLGDKACKFLRDYVRDGLKDAMAMTDMTEVEVERLLKKEKAKEYIELLRYKERLINSVDSAFVIEKMIESLNMALGEKPVKKVVKGEQRVMYETNIPAATRILELLGKRVGLWKDEDDQGMQERIMEWLKRH